MHDESVRVYIDEILRHTEYCLCGDALQLVAHDGALWLECPAYARPSRLPASLRSVVRTLFHDRRFGIELPGAVAPVAVPEARGAVRAARPAVARA